MYVLVCGWPGSGKSTLAPALAAELGWPLLAKDVIKEAVMAALGPPPDVAASRRLGAAAVAALLAAARTCDPAVLESSWVPASHGALAGLPGPFAEVLCDVPRDVAVARYRRRAPGRAPGHLDEQRGDDELWGSPPYLPGAGPLVRVDTTAPVDVPALAVRVRGVLAGQPPEGSRPASSSARCTPGRSAS